ncbi:hypothetical protein VPH35_138080 [Triticum aestivum]|uniref:Peroxidase 1 n=1 Tax=Aegilops tauschii TaxID=37682 RepID=M8AYJ7_AEGTA
MKCLLVTSAVAALALFHIAAVGAGLKLGFYILIDSTANRTAEKDAIPNKPNLCGFEVIDAAKKAIKAQCPKTVSCTDILAFTAHDSIALPGNVTYKVPAGRGAAATPVRSDGVQNYC